MDKTTETAMKEAVKNNPDAKEIIFRTGEAKKVYNKVPLEIQGNIDAPSRFFNQRPDLYDKTRSFCLVSKTNGTITLVVNEDDPETKKTVSGKIEVAKLFQKLGINKTDKSYNPTELANTFKLLRSIFESKAAHLEIVRTLQNLKAKVKQDLDNNDDKRGNVSNSFTQTVEANIPESFNLILPLIEGEEAKKIEVYVSLEASSGHDINCYLESMDAAEIVDQEREKRVDEEVKKLEGLTTIIFV